MRVQPQNAAAPGAATCVAILAATIVLLDGRELAQAAQSECGQPVSNGDAPTASDSLFTLQAAVGFRLCDVCVCDVNGDGVVSASDGLAMLSAATGLDVPLLCPECDAAAQCPGIAQFALFSGTRGPCATNDDCGGIAVCNPMLSRCQTATAVDSGWTGIAHDGDTNDIVPARLILDCEGPAPCGECAIVDLDPLLQNCRCADDNRQVCFRPFEADEQSCGGSVCNCYFGPPVAQSAGNTPTCVVSGVDAIGGLVDVDAGAGTIELDLRTRVHLGISLLQPCPYCDGDPVPADGRRGGTCVGGQNDGETCDAQSANTTFPAPGGGRHSLDCFPSVGANVSGVGLRVDVDLTTGPSILEANLRCSELPIFEGLFCPCRVCSEDPTRACNSNEDCARIDAGTCSSDGAGVSPRPNACSDAVCVDIGGGEGECATGPDDRFCDGIVRANGRGLIACQDDADCEPGTIGVDAGSCTIEVRRECFLDPIVSSGAPHPVAPRAADTFCAPPVSGSSGINSVAGLPGPARLTYQSLLTLFCKNAPLLSYTPGIGGCP
jgi:hypothetical protein